MSLSTSSTRPLANIKQAIRQCRFEKQHQHPRHYALAATEAQYPSLQTKYPPPTTGFRTSQTTRQNRFEVGLKRIPVVPPPRSTIKACPDPIQALTTTQLLTLDPTGARTRLFSPTNPERVQVGDILLFRLKTGDPVSGTVINIRQRNSPIDTAVLIRNQLTRVGLEVWFKVYSPNVESVEVVKRAVKRARRAKLYFLREKRHDTGSVEGVVKQYLRQRQAGPSGSQQGQQQNRGGKGKKGKR
ncbi:hypothetical protein LTR62_008543 [Meristemomyces frigidus]|uniref:Ribosomal protein L19 n=1 Tax=Meristemomyces frigidus TaxID=1508187 RepID=A0AAN7THY8_9PEZI|nr:hypothetical protein LTR62_008543 [Meristemomyces frigidus]